MSHVEQKKIADLINQKVNVIVSAPTSFGKTYVVFEYIARFLPPTVFLVVPTLALIDEYKKKIINTHKHIFGRYKVFTSINNETDYNQFDYKMFIVTHDRVLEETSFDTINNIDLLVIDEVYKLDTRGNDDRKLILNFAYYYLVQKSEKHILLAPFISGVDNIDHLERTLNYALYLQSKEGGDIVVVAVSAFIHDIHRILGAEQKRFVSPKESLPVVESFLDDFIFLQSFLS